ncbi:MAG: polyprenyl synthetase family protein [Kiloniellales bacterium]|nr:polyprenyl synthetase family protein [Kiloniellales bacterium]
MADLKARLEENAARVSETLDRLLPPAEGPRGTVVEAMRYSLLSPGKRMRPFLVLESAQLFGLGVDEALATAAAVEMIHCYSLIHDDLPAMDNSDLRRGRPTVHKAFDEATAILAGDGLLTEAFRVLARESCHQDPALRAELVLGLSQAAGAEGMVGGQMIDISPLRSALDLEGITELQALKTGALIVFSCEAGAILGRADDAQRQALIQYGRAVGLAFQIADDLLDTLASAEELGKPTGQDQELAKATFVGQLGVTGAKAKAESLVEEAERSLAIFGEKAEILRLAAHYIVDRRS